ncbi:MAG: hypothetical protein ABI632_13280 [Pseudolysinimonas sp.]
MRLTDRDEAMLEWLAVVRLADMDTIRYALGGLSGSGEPVSLRKAQQWVLRLHEAGLLDRARPSFNDGSVVWATHQWVGKAAPNLFRQTTRHEVAVAAVSARYLLHGYTWHRDRVPQTKVENQVDGVAVKGDRVDLIEVELTPKIGARYKGIFESHTWRLQREGVTRIVYFCDPATERVVRREADTRVFRGERHRVVTLPVFDNRGRLVGDDRPLWWDEPGAASAPAEGNGEGTLL